MQKYIDNIAARCSEPRIEARVQADYNELKMLSSNSEDLKIVRKPHVTRRNLVFIRSGSAGLCPLKEDNFGAERNFDIAVNYYAAPEVHSVLFNRADFVIGGGLSKFHAAKLFLLETGLHNQYEQTMFVDEDITFNFQLDDFFSLCHENGFSLAQPSLTSGSHVSFPITLNHPALIYRTTNFVEVMAPLFSREFLNKVINEFDLSISTWGLDIYWGHILESGGVAAVVDRFQMTHSKPKDDTNGAFYKYLRSRNIDPSVEIKNVFERLGIADYVITPKRFVYLTQVLKR